MTLTNEQLRAAQFLESVYAKAIASKNAKSSLSSIGITDKINTGPVTATQSLPRTRWTERREKARLQSQLEIAVIALQVAVDKLSTLKGKAEDPDIEKKISY